MAGECTSLSSVNENNKELLKNDKEYCKERYIYHLELNCARYKIGEPIECNKCNVESYSTRFCESCISLHLQSLNNSWTSGSEKIDELIQNCQKLSALPGSIIEWIPSDQFMEINYLTKGGFGTIYKAMWTRGRIDSYDRDRKGFNYIGSQDVVLKCLDDSNNIEGLDEVSINNIII